MAKAKGFLPVALRAMIATPLLLPIPPRRAMSRLREASHHPATAFHRRFRATREESAVPWVAVQPAVGAALALPAARQALAVVPHALRLHQLQPLRPHRTLLPAAARTETFASRNESDSSIKRKSRFLL